MAMAPKQYHAQLIASANACKAWVRATGEQLVCTCMSDHRNSITFTGGFNAYPDETTWLWYLEKDGQRIDLNSDPAAYKRKPEPELDLETLRRAVEAADLYVAGLHVGGEFRGVMPEAADRFPEDRLAQRVFMNRALGLLPNMWFDWNRNDNIITKLEPKAGAR